MLGKFLLSALLLEASVVSAFPSVAKEYADQIDELEKRAAPPVEALPFPFYPGKPNHKAFKLFSPTQKVSTTGKHRYIKPKKSDIRGPCAGLNAAANHGYLPRDGIATRETILLGLQEAFGVGLDLLVFLQSATSFLDGDPFTGKWSIGPASKKTALGGPAQEDLLGEETGICEFGHLKTEGDASITRGDWLAPTRNDNCQSYPLFMDRLLKLADKRTGGPLTPQVMAEHQYLRKKHSIATNPYYFSPPYPGIAFTFGAHMFAWQLLANHSKEYPRGRLSQKNFMTFFGYTRNSQGKLVSHPGQERIPDNYYRRSLLDAWDLTDVVVSTSQQCASYPTNCQVGGNTGEVNSFSGVDAGNISGGFIQSYEDLQDPNKLGCFISQAIQADTPSFLDKTYQGKSLALAKKLIPKTLLPALAPLGACSNLPKGRSVTQYGKGFPGAIIRTHGKKHQPGAN